MKLPKVSHRYRFDGRCRFTGCLAAGVLLLACLAAAALPARAQELYEFREGAVPRWISLENPTGAPGAGGAENRGAKGHPFASLPAGASLVLADVDGPGVIQRMWITVSDRSPEMLRALRLEMYWDGARTPAVAVPFGDFFGVGLGRTVAFESALFSNPEGRSFNVTVPMPFREHARIVLTNDADVDLSHVFYDVNYTETPPHGDDVLYFHAAWRRERPTALGRDFEVLPRVEGRGRFLGTNVGVVTDPAYGDTWWGEGEVKIYLDGDDGLPTLVGTGTEDYIGTGWGQGTFTHRYQGCTVADGRQWAFYRYHVPDPVFFAADARVTLQQIGGGPRDLVRTMLEGGVDLQPVTIDAGGRAAFVKLLERNPPPALDDPALPDGWTNFYRRDDVSATAYFYLDRPENGLPPLAPVSLRTAGLDE